MTGLDEVLKKLADLLGVGTDGLKSVLPVIGDNYQEVYATLAREMAIKSVVDTLSATIHAVSFIYFILLLVFTVVGIIEAYEDFSNGDIKLLKRAWLGGLVLIILIGILAFAPLLYPNINLISHLIRDSK